MIVLGILADRTPQPSSNSEPIASSATYQERDAGLLPPLNNFDVNAEPIKPIPELGMSEADVANFREWLAAGAPRNWNGKDQFPEMPREQWDQWRKSTRETLNK